jgi:hypothetical protein
MTVQAAVAQAEQAARGAASERDQVITNAGKETANMRDYVQRLERQLEDSQEASLEEMQDLRDEYEDKLARNRATADQRGEPSAWSGARHDASAEDHWDYDLGDTTSGKGPSGSRASFRAADRSSSREQPGTGRYNTGHKELKREMMRELRQEMRANGRRDEASTSEAESEEAPEDQVWLRAGQYATYPPKFLLCKTFHSK